MLPRRVTTALVAVVALAGCGPLSACGSDDPDDGRASRIVVETSDPSPDVVRMRAPAGAHAGLTEIELRNRGDMLHDAQLFRVDGDHGPADVVGVLEQADNTPKPRWLHPTGGVAPTAPGETAVVIQVLQPGTYYVVDTQERAIASGGKTINAGKQGIARIEVDGETEEQLPPTRAQIVAREYGFDTAGIEAGRNRVAFRNAGGQFHQATAFRIPDGVDFLAGRRAVLERRRETGWVPVDVPHQRATTVLARGGEQIAELDLDPGRYLLLCFVSDRGGGAPQWTLGMSARLDVPSRETAPER